jgi:hypothetical protein
VILRSQRFADGYLIKHEFMKKLHERYREEGIVIPFPIRNCLPKNPSRKQRAIVPELGQEPPAGTSIKGDTARSKEGKMVVTESSRAASKNRKESDARRHSWISKKRCRSYVYFLFFQRALQLKRDLSFL